MSEINEFLKSQTIFMTGVTGFLGKVLLWKILNEVGDSNVKLFVLVRSSKDASAKKRIDEVFETKIFQPLVQAKPFVKDRVHVVEGDITKKGFGISKEDYEMVIKETTVVIHSAATTKFTENLKLAVEQNMVAVLEVLQLAKKCTKLISMVHVSTAYVAANRPNEEIQEKIYPHRWNPYEVMEMVSKMTLEEADAKTASMIEPYPNTYSWTKSLAEHIIEKERGNLPICLVRPSIVTASLQEPVPGWIDVLLGPTGLFVAVGVGAFRVMRGTSKNVVDFIPCDLVVNGIIASAWRNVVLTKSDPEYPSKYPIYHLTSSTANPVTWYHPRQLISPYFRLFKPKRQFGYPFAFFCEHDFTYNLCVQLFHVLPAYIVDATRLLQGKKTFMVRAATRLNKASASLVYFTKNYWFFHNNQTEKLLVELPHEDKKVYYMDVKAYEWTTYFVVMCHGIRKYLLNEDDSELMKPHEKLQQLKQQQESQSLLGRLMGYMRSYLFLISFGCLIYFFRQNAWILKYRAQQLRQVITNTVLKLTAQ